MGYWRQDRGFDFSKMGTKNNYCLKNVREAFGIGRKYRNAKDAMLANKNAGTLHPISTLPKNVAVPVFCDTSSPDEHVEVADRGTFYSDGKRVSDPYNQRFFGWGETLNGVRIVSWVEDAKKSNEEIAHEVMAGKWGNGQERKDRLAQAGYDYNAVQSIVNQLAGGGSSGGSINVGDKVLPNSWTDYNGIRLAKTRNFYFVKQINGDRVVLVADSVNGPVYCAIKVSNLRRV